MMPNHIHLIVKAQEGSSLSDIDRAFLKHSIKKKQEAVILGIENRQEFLKDKFAFKAR
ncbi:MAG: hypothetical protein H7329_10030 [Opitutaceae bacterium]|nr:hypothetical protein [Cytophagales bacterium]